MIAKMWDIAAKDLLQLRNDRGALLLMFAVPLLLMGLLGSAFNGAFSSGSSIRATLPVVNYDTGSASRALIAALRRVPSVSVQVRTNESVLKKSVRDGDRPGLLIIPAGFSAALHSPRPAARVTYYAVANNADADAQLARDVVQATVQEIAFEDATAQAVSRAELQATGKANPVLAQRLAARAGRQLAQSPPAAVRTVNATGKKYNAQDNTVPGYALMFALFAVTGSAGTILAEKESGTFQRLLVAPVPPLALLGGKLLGQFIQTLVQLTVLFALGFLFFKINVGSSVLALALLIIATSFAATGVGLILVSFIKSQAQLRPVTTLIVLSFSALGGSWWPISIEPQWMQTLSKVTVNSWAMQGFNSLMIFDKSFVQVLPDIGALFLYGLICFAIARRAFRFRPA